MVVEAPATALDLLRPTLAIPPTSYRGLSGPSGPSVLGSVPKSARALFRLAPGCPKSVPRMSPESLGTPRGALPRTPVFGDTLGDIPVDIQPEGPERPL